MSNPYQVVKDFEAALCEYTGARYAVTTTSCTMALLLALKWHLRNDLRHYDDDQYLVVIPKRTYIGVPMSIMHAGGWPIFEECTWSGAYRLGWTPVLDSARRFTSGMYSRGPLCDIPEAKQEHGDMQCVSFHWTKTLSVGQGGAILHDNPEADAYLRRTRFDGRTEGVPSSEDAPTEVGYHAYMSPRDAAEGLSRLATLPAHNEDLPWDDYPDLSTLEIFK